MISALRAKGSVNKTDVIYSSAYEEAKLLYLLFIRDVHSALVLDMDYAVKKVVRALKKNDLYRNTIIVFTSDNGGTVKHGGSNWPLRGNKVSL